MLRETVRCVTLKRHTNLMFIMGFPTIIERVRLNSEPKRYKIVSLSAKRSVLLGVVNTESLCFQIDFF